MIDALQPLCQELAAELENKELVGRTVSIKTKTVDFDVSTRSLTLKHSIQSESELFKYASQLLTKHQPVNLRLLGVRISGLSLASDEDDDHQQLISDFVHKFDSEAVKCPICLKPISEANSDGTIINAHIDECLTRRALSQERRDSTSVLPTSPKPKKKHPSTLENYFAPKRKK